MRAILYILVLLIGQNCLAQDNSRDKYYQERLNYEYEQQRQLEQINQNIAKQNQLIEEQNNMERLRQSQEMGRELQIENNRRYQSMADSVINSTINPPFVSNR